ncbi:MAG: hypothetical protein V5A84_05360 [Planctomycetota bacterium]
MSEATSEKPQRWAWFRRNVLGLALGAIAACYGIFALIVGETYLPGLAGNDHTLSDQTGTALAAGYLAGGLFLMLRLYVEERIGSEEGWKNLYLAQNVLLIALIACVGYVLFHVGSAH